jgi:hypothetical protein
MVTIRDAPTFGTGVPLSAKILLPFLLALLT